ncbi:MAG: WG repeat-containing protein [Flavobacteriales bacterium]|nr:WG repeat-containing protein [Flavobacteriales bacterium]
METIYTSLLQRHSVRSVRPKLLVLLLALVALTEVAGQKLITQVRPSKDELWGYMDNTGRFIVQPSYKQCFNYNESGYALVKDAETGKAGFIDLNGRLVSTQVVDFLLISAIVDDGQDFLCGLVPVKINEKWGFMNTQGVLAIEAIYDRVEPFAECIAVVMRDEKSYLLRGDGVEMPFINPQVTKIREFKEGLSAFKTLEGKHGFLDPHQRIVIPAQYAGVGNFSAGLAWARAQNEKIGFLNKTGAWAIQPQFDLARDFDPVSGLALVKADDKWMYVSREGRVLQVNNTERYYEFHEGLAKVVNKELVGFIDASGAWVIPPRFEAARHFKNGMVAVRERDLWGFIDTKGNWVIQPQFLAVRDMERVEPSADHRTANAELSDAYRRVTAGGSMAITGTARGSQSRLDRIVASWAKPENFSTSAALAIDLEQATYLLPAAHYFDRAIAQATASGRNDTVTTLNSHRLACNHFGATKDPNPGPVAGWQPSAWSGIIYGIRPEGVFVADVFEGSGAELGGIWPGDRIVQIGNHPVAPDVRSDSLDRWMRGSANSELPVRLERLGKDLYKAPLCLFRSPQPRKQFHWHKLHPQAGMKRRTSRRPRQNVERRVLKTGARCREGCLCSGALLGSADPLQG